MAIFPVRSNYVIDVDAFTSASYKAGMAIVRDDNGRAIVADSQQLVFKNIYQKSGKFLGFAASDHDVSGNTIIRPDVVGSSYLDSSYGYVQFKDNEFLSPKRALADNLDETVSKFYNNTEILSTTRRGIGVYNQPGEIYITDQFSPVLHGDYGFDGLDTQTLNPGDLLTFGGGVNAGKLVKVNLNSLGPDVLVIGQVEKYVSQTGLLHFRLVNYSLSFGTNNLTMFYDFGNPFSYTSGSTVYDLSTNNVNGTLTNGPIYSSTPYPSLVFDGTNDYINISNSYSANFSNGITIDFWVRYNGNGPYERIIDINNGPNTVVLCVFRYTNTNQLGLATAVSPFTNPQTAGMLSNSNVIVSGTIQNFTFVIGPGTVGSTAPYNNMYLNGVLVPTSDYLTGRSQIPDVTNRTFWIGRTPFNDAYLSANLFSVKMYNQAFTATQVLNQYNATKSRYGL